LDRIGKLVSDGRVRMDEALSASTPFRLFKAVQHEIEM